MQKNVVILILALIFSINFIAIICIQLGRDDGEKDKENEIAIVEDAVENDGNKEEDGDEGDGENEDEDDGVGVGEIGDGLYVDVSAEENDVGTGSENYKAIAKSEAAQAEMALKGQWIAVDYSYGDITSDNWTVRRGDTLWEISEAKFGNGSSWQNILEKNSSKIGNLPSGQQALIFPGQVLVF